MVWFMKPLSLWCLIAIPKHHKCIWQPSLNWNYLASPLRLLLVFNDSSRIFRSWLLRLSCQFTAVFIFRYDTEHCQHTQLLVYWLYVANWVRLWNQFDFRLKYRNLHIRLPIPRLFSTSASADTRVLGHNFALRLHLRLLRRLTNLLAFVCKKPIRIFYTRIASLQRLLCFAQDGFWRAQHFCFRRTR